MPLRQKKTGKLLRRALLAALLAAACLISALPVLAADDTEGDYIVKYKKGVLRLMEDDGVPFDVVSKEEALRLAEAGLLEWYEPDGEGFLLDEPSTGSAYYESYQWNLDLIRAEDAFRRDCIGQGVRIGVIDSGVNPHPDLADRLLPGRNCIEGARNETDTADNYDHGTAVAGLIAGAGDRGYIGVAPAAELVPLKITDGGNFKVSNLCRAIYAGVDDFHCDVLNLSLGVTGTYETLREAVDYAESKGVLLVSGSGNNGRTTRYYPAAYDSVISVGMVDRDGEIADRSTHNDSVLLAAPGWEVRSTKNTGSYKLYSGTSFAVPQVAGAAAAALSINGYLTPADLRQLLAGTAADRGDEGRDPYYGCGILDVAAIFAALPGEYEPPEPKDPDLPCAFTLPSRLRNYSDEDITCTYILAVYSQAGRCRSIRTWTYTVPARGYVDITPPEENTIYGQFACEAATMNPLAKARKSL
jgi:subtilisin family serine protease